MGGKFQHHWGLMESFHSKGKKRGRKKKLPMLCCGESTGGVGQEGLRWRACGGYVGCVDVVMYAENELSEDINKLGYQ